MAEDIKAVNLGLNKEQSRTAKSAIYRLLVAKRILAFKFSEFRLACQKASVQLAKFGKQIELCTKKKVTD